jgi:hypothetical protein
MKRFNLSLIFSWIALAIFPVYFSFELITLKRGFNHRDIATVYYPFRNWFTQRLKQGEFPLWNPYWGVGITTSNWANIPIDMFTPFEMIFGPQYHYFQMVQVGLLITACYYALVKLRFHPLIAVTGAILYFMTPWVTYFHFYFIKTNLFACLPLSFIFIYSWMRFNDPKYLFYLFWTVVLGMFGTKMEFWFFQTVSLTFLCLLMAAVVSRGGLIAVLRKSLPPILVLGLGILAHAWQLNLLLRITQYSGRIFNASLLNIFSAAMYDNFIKCLAEFELGHMCLVGTLVYFASRKPGKWLWLLLGLGGVFILVFRATLFPIIGDWMNGPVLLGALLGAVFSQVLRIARSPRDHLRTLALFFIFVFYWCRPGSGDFGEMETLRSAPDAFKMLLAVLIWLGCGQFRKRKLVRVAYFWILSILLMRVYGSLFLIYLTGWVWMPTRDNYLVDFGMSILAVYGLSAFRKMPKLGLFRKYWTPLVAASTVCAIIYPMSGDLYFSHKGFLLTSLPNFPYYAGVPRVRQLLRDLKKSSTDRIFYEPFAGQAFGSNLFEDIGQVAVIYSLTPKIYRDWVIYKKLGIRPEKNWSAYHAAFRYSVISKWPPLNPLGYSRVGYYINLVESKPPLAKEVLAFLGVNYLVFLKGEPVPKDPIPPLISDLPKKSDMMIVVNNDWVMVGRMNNVLPRAFMTYGVNENNKDEFTNELDPVYKNGRIETRSSSFLVAPDLIAPIKIESYAPEKVSLTVDTPNEGYAVLADLYHPFWKAKLDGVDVEIERAFYIYRGVKVPPGTHSLIFYCEVPWMKESFGLSLAMILASFVGFWFILPRRKKNDRSF